MTKPQVLNKHWSPSLPNSVYVGRPTKWGNPFTHLAKDTQARFKVDTREDAVLAFERYLTKMIEKDPTLLLRIRSELGGKNLVCWCAPAKCHAEVLLKFANPDLEGENSAISTTESQNELSPREPDGTIPQSTESNSQDGKKTVQ
mgnify:FL=1